MAESKFNDSEKGREKPEENEDGLLCPSREFAVVEGQDHEAATLSPECAICLQAYVHPARLPCGHIFCFLCVKGVANQSKKCAMCRQEIPSDYLEKPQLLEQAVADKESSGFDDGHQWFYEGRNGWWQYDERTSRELETAYKRGERHCELLIAGFLYVADFDAMLQLRRNDPSRRRRIKRDLATIPKKGVAGLRLVGEGPAKAAVALDMAAEQLHSLTLQDSSSEDDELPPPVTPWMVPLSSSSSDEDQL